MLMNKLKVFLVLSNFIIFMACQEEDPACFNDPECRRNVISCFMPGCCGSKICPEDGGECEVVMPVCAPPVEVEMPQLEMSEESKRICLNDEDCHESFTYCPVEGCCASKVCTPEGECTTTISPCYKERYVDLNDNDCFSEENCYRNITSCGSDGGCCGFKSCQNGQCFIAIPSCIGPEIPIIEEPLIMMSPEGMRICLNNEECLESVTYCPVEDCCASKECTPEGVCTKTMSQCYKERYDDLNDNDCFWEENCYRNIRSCSQDGCCGFKTCEKGECFVAIPSCVGPPAPELPQEEPVLGVAPNSENTSSNPPNKVNCKNRHSQEKKAKKASKKCH